MIFIILAISSKVDVLYAEPSGQLIEKDRCDKNVVIWLGEYHAHDWLKHAKTFWIHTKSTIIYGVEYFDIISVTHTKLTLTSRF